jgi:signal transduction histidine kinase
MELNAEMEKVDSLNQIKDKLFSIISHDLRGPIVPLKGIVSLFNQRALTAEELLSVSKGLEKDLNRMSDLIDNLLASSKSQLDGLALQKSKLIVVEVFRKLSSLYQNQIDAKALTIENDTTDDMEVFGDNEMIQIVFRNLVSNAIKFTPHGGTISLSAHNERDFCEIEISDSGVGIDPQKLNNLFHLGKANLIGTSSASGAGIGLLLV